VEDRPLTLKDFVRTDLLKLDCNESVWDAAKPMKERDTDNVVVTVNGVPTGMVTQRDVLNKVAVEDFLLRRSFSGRSCRHP